MAAKPKTKEKPVKTIKDFNKKYKDVLISPDKLVRTDKQLLRTGSIKLDLMLRGGFRAGTISELYGAEGGGKTTLALSVAKEVLNKGGAVLFFDLERSLDGGVDYEDRGHLDGWMEIIGIPADHANFHVHRPMTGEAIYTMVEEAIKASLFDLIVLDSMAALIPRADLEGDIGESAYGKVAKLNSEALKRVLAAYDSQKVERTHFMVINQARDTIGTTVKGLRSPGGRALKHFVRTRLRCTRVAKKPGGINVITIRVDKNAFSPPWELVELYIHPLYGIDTMMEILEVAIENGIVTKDGNWLTLHDPKTGDEVGKGNGREQFRKVMLENMPIIDQIRADLWEKGLGNLVGTTPPEENDD